MQQIVQDYNGFKGLYRLNRYTLRLFASVCWLKRYCAKAEQLSLKNAVQIDELSSLYGKGFGA